jgi:hypothetical protein
MRERGGMCLRREAAQRDSECQDTEQHGHEQQARPGPPPPPGALGLERLPGNRVSRRILECGRSQRRRMFLYPGHAIDCVRDEATH